MHLGFVATSGIFSYLMHRVSAVARLVNILLAGCSGWAHCECWSSSYIDHFDWKAHRSQASQQTSLMYSFETTQLKKICIKFFCPCCVTEIVEAVSQISVWGCRQCKIHFWVSGPNLGGANFTNAQKSCSALWSSCNVKTFVLCVLILVTLVSILLAFFECVYKRSPGRYLSPLWFVSSNVRSFSSPLWKERRGGRHGWLHFVT